MTIRVFKPRQFKLTNFWFESAPFNDTINLIILRNNQKVDKYQIITELILEYRVSSRNKLKKAVAAIYKDRLYYYPDKRNERLYYFYNRSRYYLKAFRLKKPYVKSAKSSKTKNNI